jgi:hypothetical protein
MIQLIEFEKLVLPEVISCPTPTLTQAVLDSVVDFCEETHIFSKSFNETVAAVNTDINDYVDINVSEYVTDKIVIAVAEFLIDGVVWKLKYMELENASTNISALREDDEKLFSFPDNGTVRIHELTVGQEVFLTCVYKPTYSITEIDDIIYNDWQEAIAAGAKQRLMAIPGQPWSNLELSQYYNFKNRRGVSEAKLKKQKGYTTAPDQVNWRAFGE